LIRKDNTMICTLRTTLGFLLIVAGVIALPIPILPGLPFIAAGATLLGPKHPLIHRCRVWLVQRGFMKDTASTGVANTGTARS
jgi:uncharacterized protein YqgC (DUF456 family)